MAKYFLSIDLGTSSVRAFLIDFEKKVSYVKGENYDVLIPQLGYAEQDPLSWYDRMAGVIRELLRESGVDPEEIVAMSFSGQMHGMVALDAENRPVMNVPLWLDQRSGGAIAEIYEKLGAELVKTSVQNQIATGFLLASLYWTKTRRPELYERIAHVMLPKDYVKFRLCGRIATDYSDASGSTAFDSERMAWSDAIIDGLGLKREIFPEILSSTDVAGHITAQAARDTGLSERTLVVEGGSDQCMQSIGNAVIDEGVLASNIGTSSLISTPTKNCVYDPLLRTNTFAHVLPGQRCVVAAHLNGGSILKWLTRKVIGVEDYNEVNRMVASRGPCSNGLIFLPYLAGERTPHMDPKARGVFFGLNLDHDRADMARAVMEGVVFGMKEGLNVQREMGISCKRIVAAGGGARSDVWLQMQADIFESPIFRSASKEQACLGAAMTAAVGAGEFSGFDEACARCVEPSTEVFNPIDENVRIYRRMFDIFHSLYINNKQSFADIGEVFRVK